MDSADIEKARGSFAIPISPWCGLIAKMMEDQRKIEEMVSGGAIGKLLEEQRKFEEMLNRLR